LEGSRRSARSRRSATGHDRQFLANARKAIAMSGRAAIGATATIGLIAGLLERDHVHRGTTALAAPHAKTEAREAIGPMAGRLARVRGRPGKIASMVRRAKDVNRAATAPIAGQLARARGRPGKIASMARRAKAVSREATAPIAGRLAARVRDRRARSVSADPIDQQDLAAAVRRDSAIVRVRRVIVIGHAPLIATRAIDQKRIQEIGRDSRHRATAIVRVRRAPLGSASDSAPRPIGTTAIDRAPRVKAGNANAPGRRAGRGRPAAARLARQAGPGSGRRVAIAAIVRVVAVQAVDRDRGPREARHGRRARRGRRVTATVRLASGATTTKGATRVTWSSTSSSSAPRRT
jgi:hypothetical protein